MVITSPHDPVHQVSLIRQEQKPLGILIQPPYRIDTHRIIQIFRDGGLASLLFGAADDPSGLIKEKEHLPVFPVDRHTVHTNLRIRRNPLPGGDNLAVDRDPPGIRVPVRVPPGADADAAQIFIDPDFLRLFRVSFFVHCLII